jgi:hypothetical protein
MTRENDVADELGNISVLSMTENNCVGDSQEQTLRMSRMPYNTEMYEDDTTDRVESAVDQAILSGEKLSTAKLDSSTEASQSDITVEQLAEGLALIQDMHKFMGSEPLDITKSIETNDGTIDFGAVTNNAHESASPALSTVSSIQDFESPNIQQLKETLGTAYQVGLLFCLLEVLSI